MSVAVIRSPESIRDVENIVQFFIDQETPATALKFGKAVMRTLDLLAAFPEIGSPWESKELQLEGVRFQNVRGFRRYVIFYRMMDDGLLVMRILDGRRNLGPLL